MSVFCLKIIGSVWLPLILLINDVCAQEVRLISDEETEQLLNKIAKPLFKAANLPFNNREIYIVDDNSLNAFVADGNNLFIHTGTIINSDTPDELAGVIAHEIGHISGGHILRQKLKIKSMQDISLVSAIAAGAAAVFTGNPDIAVATMLGTQSSIITNFTQYKTTEERSADETALSLLEKTNQNPQGMLSFMKKILTQNRLHGVEETAYFRTHPLTRERISFFEQALNNTKSLENKTLQNEFEAVKAKLKAYLQSPELTFRQYPQTDKSVPARYARAIAYFKQLKITHAKNELDYLSAQYPLNPYFYELKGQIFLETGNAKSAKKEYLKALKILPNSALLQLSLAQSILEDTPSKEEMQHAINLINKAIIKRPTSFGWLLLARAYGLVKKNAHAYYASAEYSTKIGAFDVAENQLKKALKLNPDKQLKLKISDLQNKLKKQSGK